MFCLKRTHQRIVPSYFSKPKRKNPPFNNTTAKQVSKGGFNRHEDGISRQ
jgi:hypothetical protein